MQRHSYFFVYWSAECILRSNHKRIMEERRTFSQFPTASPSIRAYFGLTVENNLFTRLPPSTRFCVFEMIRCYCRKCIQISAGTALPQMSRMHEAWMRVESVLSVYCFVRGYGFLLRAGRRTYIVLTATTWSCKSNAFFVYITRHVDDSSPFARPINSIAFACHTNRGGGSLTKFTSLSKA